MDTSTAISRAQEHVATASKPLIVVVGPTASGKTGFSIELAKALQPIGEVVNADSRQLYTHLDIGTAKITLEEAQDVPHHLLDVLDPTEEATVGWYQPKALQAIDDILARQHTPLLVGGSMLYVSSVIDGLSLAPPADPVVRERLLQEYDKDNGVTLHKRLADVDPESAAWIHPNNKPYLVRAVEICELTKVPKSQQPATELRSAHTSPAYDLLIFGMHVPREVLTEKIAKRAALMFEQGWIEEVQRLINRGYTAEAPGMKSHGYREIMQYVQHGEPATLEELQTLITNKTRQYSKRQVSWWKNDERIQWVTP